MALAGAGTVVDLPLDVRGGGTLEMDARDALRTKDVMLDAASEFQVVYDFDGAAEPMQVDGTFAAAGTIRVVTAASTGRRRSLVRRRLQQTSGGKTVLVRATAITGTFSGEYKGTQRSVGRRLLQQGASGCFEYTPTEILYDPACPDQTVPPTTAPAPTPDPPTSVADTPAPSFPATEQPTNFGDTRSPTPPAKRKLCPALSFLLIC